MWWWSAQIWLQNLRSKSQPLSSLSRVLLVENHEAVPEPFHDHQLGRYWGITWRDSFRETELQVAPGTWITKKGNWGGQRKKGKKTCIGALRLQLVALPQLYGLVHRTRDKKRAARLCGWCPRHRPHSISMRISQVLQAINLHLFSKPRFFPSFPSFFLRRPPL